MRFNPFLLAITSFTYLNLTSGNSATAQITPDNTLGAESSVVSPNQIIKGIKSDRIDGGAIRGENLFHSFTDFNIKLGKGAYFTNPTGIENILMRVTGSNASHILGTLGVLGNANLFFVNPNGIVFGANARLDVNGSFVGSAAQSFVFGNGLEFSATHPQAPPLLKINLPIGLQTQTNRGDINNAGNLAVNPLKNLTLFGSTVTSTGSLIAPGGTVQVLGERVGLFDRALIDVSANTGGGKVLIGGDLPGKGAIPNAEKIYIAPGVNINANAQTFGNGGSVIIFAEDTAQIYGKISTRGGLLGGNGGFVETSGRQFLDITTTPDIQAPAGIGGNWLIDPNNIEIVADGTGNSKITPTNPFQSTGDTSKIEVNLIVNALKSGNVTLSTTEAGANSEAGDITLNAKLDFDGIGTGKTLTLNAHNDILINAPISDRNTLTTDSLNLVFNANSDRRGFGSVEIVPILFTPDDSILTGGGNITIQGNGDTSPGILTVVPINSGGGNISLTGTSTNGQGIVKISSINSAGGKISLIGDSNNAEGIFIVSSINSGNGDITLTADRNYIDGTVTGSGNLVIQPLTPSLNLELGRNHIDAGATFLDNYELSHFTNGFATITIGRADSSGTINVLGNITFNDPVTLRSPVGNGNIILNNSLRATGSLSLEAAKDIISNNAASIFPFTSADLVAPLNIALKADSINLTNSNLVTYGGKITINAAGDIKINTIDSSSRSSNGGAINLDAGGNIALEKIDSYTAGSDGKYNAGAVTIKAQGNIITESIATLGSNISGAVNFDAGGNITTGSIITFGHIGGAVNLDAGGNITTGEIITKSDSGFDSNTNMMIKGGAITLTAGGNISTHVLYSFFDSVFQDTLAEGFGGDITLTAGGNISTAEVFSYSSSEVGNTGNGGAIAFTAGGNISTQDLYSFSYSKLGNSENGGAIALTSGGNISTGTLNSFSYSLTGDSGNGGAIALSAKNGNITGLTSSSSNLNSLSVSKTGNAGAGGNVSLEAKNQISDLEILTLSSSSNSGEFKLTGFGDLSVINTNIITTKQVTINIPFFPPITLDVGGEGQSGNVNISSLGNLSFNNSSIASDTKGINPAGNVNINSAGLINFNDSKIISNTSSTGQAGNINLQAEQGITLTGRNSELFAKTNNQGNAGFITLEAPLINLQQGAQISTSTTDIGKAGDILLNTDTLTLANGGEILAFTQGSGDGGTIRINATNAINLGEGVQDFAPIISVETSSAGKAGNIILETPNFTLSETARITATATATATNTQGGGSITLNASKIDLAGIVGVFAETQGQAPAGTLTLQPDNNKPTLDLTLAPGAIISASTSASGNGGDLLVTAPQTINISGQGKLAVETTGAGNAGNIKITTQQFTLNDGVEISASTSSNGRGGNLTVNASFLTQLQNQSRLLTQASGTGTAGNVTINTPQLNLRSQAKISANTISSLGGDIQLQELNTLKVNNSEISASTQTGKAGNLRVNAADSVELNASALSVEATGKNGIAGDLTVKTNQFNLANGAQVTVSSPQGQAGNIDITANSLFLNQGFMTAETGNSGTESGANINLQISDWLQLKNESLISAKANNTANGGNINIDTKFLIAFPSIGSQGSDIIANAEFGNGGRININAEGVFGIQFREVQTRFNDFSVSSEFGSSGEVEINTAIDPSVGLTQLPSVPVETQVSQACKPQKTENQSKFIITGRGGLPANPYESLQADSGIKKWVTVDEDKNTTDNNSNFNITTNHPPEAIVEAQGLIKDKNGDIYLVAQAPKVTPHSPTLTPIACSDSH